MGVSISFPTICKSFHPEIKTLSNSQKFSPAKDSRYMVTCTACVPHLGQLQTVFHATPHSKKLHPGEKTPYLISIHLVPCKISATFILETIHQLHGWKVNSRAVFFDRQKEIEEVEFSPGKSFHRWYFSTLDDRKIGLNIHPW